MQFSPQVSASIENLTQQIAAAVDEAGLAVDAVGRATEPRDKIAERLSALAAQRAEILHRRHAGHHEAGDGEGLMLIQADSEGLAAMLPEAAGKVDAAQNSLAAAASRVARLRTQLNQVEALGTHEALLGYATALGAKLLATIDAMERAGKSAGIQGRPVWSAPDLHQKLRVFAAARGEL